MRFLILRVVVPLVLLLIVRALIAAVIKGFSSLSTTPQKTSERTGTFKAGGELKKDPVCGTYVSAGAAVTRQIKGETLHFCSIDCRDKYREA